MTRLARGNSFTSAIIILNTSEAEAVRSYESHLQKSFNAKPEDPVHIEHMDSVPVFDRIITDADPQPLELALTLTAPAEQDALADDPESDLNVGWWADCDQLIHPDNVPADVEAFRRSLPQDIESELSWDCEKKHTFLIRVFRRCEEDQPVAAIVQAPNAPFAAWLWRRNAQGTPLSHNPIAVDPCCPVVNSEEQLPAGSEKPAAEA